MLRPSQLMTVSKAGNMPDQGPRFNFKLGDTLRIKAAPFQGFTGTVSGINQAKLLLKITVKIFGQIQPVKLTFREIEKP